MTEGLAEVVALGVGFLVTAAEALHARRSRRLARLAFGPTTRPAPWARFAPAFRVASAAATAWGLTTLLLIPPKNHQAQTLPDAQRQNLLLVLDVSPSMRLPDAGPDGNLSRAKRAADVIGSLFQRVSIERYLISVIACYNGSKPVVVGTKDMEVVRNILTDLPMSYAFQAGKTDLFSGLTEAANVAHPWNPRSTLLVVLTDGDTVPPTGMPRLPASISDVLIVGVGDPRTGRFIDGRQSRQDASTLRQLAARLDGAYHDANQKHLPTDLIRRLTFMPRETLWERPTRREYALFACGLGATVLAFLPLALHHVGTRWHPGVPENRPPRDATRQREAVATPR
ncbi:MAG: VWA domain-containing protein [Isosphaeraceae bacterium]